MTTQAQEYPSYQEMLEWDLPTLQAFVSRHDVAPMGLWDVACWENGGSDRECVVGQFHGVIGMICYGIFPRRVSVHQAQDDEEAQDEEEQNDGEEQETEAATDELLI